MKCATGRWIRDWDPIKNFGLLSLIFPIYKAQIGCPQSVISTGESLNFDPRPPLCLCYNIGLRCMIQSTHCTSQVKHRPFSVPMQGFDLAVLEDNQSDPNQGSAAWSKRRHVTTLRSRDMRLRSRDSWGQSGHMTKGTSYSQWISQQQAIIQSREAVGLQGINNGKILPLSMYILLVLLFLIFSTSDFLSAQIYSCLVQHSVEFGCRVPFLINYLSYSLSTFHTYHHQDPQDGTYFHSRFAVNFAPMTAQQTRNTAL